MSESQEKSAGQNENTYVIDQESASEMARLIRQDQIITSGMGGIFPESIDLSGAQHVLDLACGPGSWALDVAYTYSDIEVVGVDISERMIAYARAQAEVQQRSNVDFQVMNILQPLAFPANSFDLVNARLISGFMLREKWPTFFQECLRVLRPGGIMRLTEIEVGIANKPNFERTMYLGTQAMSRAGLCFSPNGLHYGMIHMLPHLFRQAGLPILGKMSHFLEFSYGTAAHESFYQDFTLAFQLFTPLVVKMQLASQEEWTELVQKGLAEMYEEDFCAAWTLLTIWGEKSL
jgi:ubiquinone/menaquinone biosynthesis C-methylase UbiE